MKAFYNFIIMSGLFILGYTAIVPAVAQEPTESLENAVKKLRKQL